jgi:hypothetical protein
MDPYLEDRSFWPDVHASLIAYIREALQPQLRPNYVARIGERVELAGLPQGYVPDVLIVRPPREPMAGRETTGVAVADEPQTFTFLDEERRVPYIEIIYRETGDVVTLIEVLSPANKSGAGHTQYLQKQADLLTSQVNLVEIDLLGQGRPTTLARTVEIEQPSNWRYVVSVSRAHQRQFLEVYAFALTERLPRCRIPLRAEDADVVLDLPAVFARCYDVGGYDLMIDYTQAPPIPLSDEEETWLRTLLHEKGIRMSGA